VRRGGTFRARQRSMSWMSVARLSAAGSAARAASTPRAWALTSSVAGGALLPPPLSPPPPLAAHTSQPPLHAAGGSPKCLQRLRDERAVSLSGWRRDASRKHCCPAREVWRLQGDKRHIADIQGLEKTNNSRQNGASGAPAKQAASTGGCGLGKAGHRHQVVLRASRPACADRTASCIMSHRRRRHWASVALLHTVRGTRFRLGPTVRAMLSIALNETLGRTSHSYSWLPSAASRMTSTMEMFMGHTYFDLKIQYICK